MIRWNLGPAMAAAKVDNAFQLAKLTGLGYAVAYRAVEQEPVSRIDVGTLVTIAKALKCERDPLALLEYIPDKK